MPDLDGDGDPGLTIKGGDGHENTSDPRKQHAWTYETGLLGLSLHGPLTIHLTAASKDFHTDKKTQIWVYVYNCPAGLATTSTALCTRIGSNTVLVAKWNSSPTWATHDIVVPVDADLPLGRQLRIRILTQGEELWVPLVSPYATAVELTH